MRCRKAREAEPCGVDVVRAFFAGFDAEAAKRQGPGEAEREERFPAASGKAGDDKAGRGDGGESGIHVYS